MQVGYDIDWLGGGEEGDASSVAIEAEVAVVGDDVHGGVPGDLRGRAGARSGVVDGADVGAGEAEAGSGVVHCAVGGMGGCQGKGQEGMSAGWRKGMGLDGMPGDGADEGVVHGCEAEFVAMADSPPDTIFCCDEVGKPFADEGETGEGGDI